MPLPEVAQARLIRSKIAEQGGANSAEDDDVVDHFFDEIADDEADIEANADEQNHPEPEQETYFNPPRASTPTFV
jgi:hypothetical protein